MTEGGEEGGGEGGGGGEKNLNCNPTKLLKKLDTIQQHVMFCVALILTYHAPKISQIDHGDKPD